MSPEPRPASDSTDTHLDDLLVEFLDRRESEGVTVLEDLCLRAPDQATRLRSRVAALQRAGLLDTRVADGAPERLGDFRVLERLGGGGMGVVYLAEQVSLGRRVALKVLRPEHLWFEGARERFRREAEAVARLSHPAIVPLFSVGEETGVPFLAMEYVHGAALSTLLADLRARPPASLTGEDLRRALEARLGPQETVRADPLRLFAGTWSEACARIARVVAEGLEHAHQRGVLHRDVKPSNVMLAADGRVLLVDFGLAARAGADRLTRTGSQLGSLPYMAPEQVGGRADEIGVRTDVYGLGVSLYEMLALRLPYEGPSMHELLRQISDGEAVPVRRWNARVSRDLETVVATAMDPLSAQRYATTEALAHDLRNVVEHRPIDAHRAGPARRALRWTQRHPAAAAAIGLAMLLAIGGPVGYAIQQKRALEDLTNEAQRTAQANLALSAALARAESNFTEALDAVALMTRVGQEPLAEVPEAEEARRELLEGSLAFQRRLADQRRGDPAFAAEVARTELRVGEILAALGRHDEAEIVFASAEQATDGLPSVLDGTAQDLTGATASLRRGASLASLGRHEEAAVAFERTIERLTPFASAGQPAMAREVLAEAWSQLAEERRVAGDEDGSIAAIESHGRIVDLLHNEFPDEPRYAVEVAEAIGLYTSQSNRFKLRVETSTEVVVNRDRILELVDGVLPALRAAKDDSESQADLLARALESRSRALYDLNREAEGIAAMRECIELRRAMAARHPGVPRRHNQLLTSLNTLGASLRASGDARGSVEALQEAVSLREIAIAREPGNKKLQAGLGIVFNNMSLAYHDLQDEEPFLATSARALASYRTYLESQPRDPFVLERVTFMANVRATYLLDRGRVEEAQADLEAVLEIEPSHRLHMARLWARVAGATGSESARERCFVLLETALGGPKAGEHLDSGDFESLSGDPRFVAVSARLRG